MFNNRQNRLIRYLLQVILVALFLFYPLASTIATPEYSGQTDRACSYCHENYDGGGTLTVNGETFRSAGYVMGSESRSLWSGLSLRFFTGFLHVLAAVIWFGTIFYIHLFVKPKSLTSGLPKKERVLGWVCIIVVGVTGIILTVFRINEIDEIWTTTFGIVWIVKVSFFLLMVAIAAVATTRLNRRMREEYEKAKAGPVSAADGKEGRPAHIVYSGQIYDVSESRLWKDGVHMRRHYAGNDLTEAMSGAPHGPEALEKVKKIGSAPSEEKGRISKPARIFVGMAYVILGFMLVILLCVAYWNWGPPLVTAYKPVSSSCADCHIDISPKQVMDFNRSKMSATMTCADCHGSGHSNADDVKKAVLPTIATCGECHPDQAEQYLSGKHALGLVALEAMPYTHMQPAAFIEGQKGCGGCHTLGLTDETVRESEGRKYYRYGMDCQNCHTRHAFSKAEASEPEACMTCHMGFDHAQWEMWSGSKHGVTYLMNRAIEPESRYRAPKCQTCHMPDGDHRVFSAWGFLAVRLPENDEEWMNYRTIILKGLGVLDPEGNPTERLEVVKAGKVARLTEEEFNAERNRYTEICARCHTPYFVQENIKNADQMIKEADKLFSEAIEIVAGLYSDGIIPARGDYQAYPDLLTFYDVNTKVEQVLYEMFMDHRMKTFQGAFHINYDYSTWYGYAKMKKDLTEIRELAQEMRSKSAK
ncbi:MAG: CopD family protein [Deltaproteobacteria bacterium]|nr:CopD family protein [Deltaproteobacteria bacterium]